MAAEKNGGGDRSFQFQTANLVVCWVGVMFDMAGQPTHPGPRTPPPRNKGFIRFLRPDHTALSFLEGVRWLLTS